MFRKLSKKTVLVGPRKAEKFLTIDLYDGQRPLRSTWVTDLANIIREDLFLVGDLSEAILKYENDRKVRMNGQHQLNAVLVANKAIEVEHSIYGCETPQDASLLYSQFDNHKARSLADVVRAEAFALNLNWPVKCSSLLVSAAIVKENRVRARKDLKMELLAHYMKQGQFLKDVLFSSIDGTSINKDFRHLHRQAVAYAILHTLEKSQSDSLRFWTDVRDGENLKRTMPAMKLRNYLMSHTLSQGQKIQAVPGRIVTFKEMASKCITAWNAFRKGIPTDLKYYPNKSIPKAI